MDRMLIVLFDNETKAYEGKRALYELDHEGSITVYANAIVDRKKDGTASIKESEDYGPLGTLLGTALGALIGAIFGPVGLAVGASIGVTGGATVDITKAAVGDDFIADVSKAVTPGKVALVAEIEEDWTTPVDTRMEKIGGTVFRRSLSDVKHQIHDENVAAMKADLAQLKAEHAQASATRGEKLHGKINELETKIQKRLEKSKEERQAAERETQAKVDILKAKAAVAAAGIR